MNLDNRILERELAATDDPEKQAYLCLRLGALMEKRGDFHSAVRWYSKGHAIEPLDGTLCYFLNNNLGYSLNQVHRFADAERYCRTAIAIDKARHNAYKNLGVSLTGQARYAEAATCFVTATRNHPDDKRALLCLERLVTERPELLSDVPDLGEDLGECRNAVRALRPSDEGIELWTAWAEAAAEGPTRALPVQIPDRLITWKLREEDLPGIQPVVRYLDSCGKQVTIEEMRPSCQYRWALEDHGTVPEEAIELYNEAMAAGQRGDYHDAMERFRQSHLIAPRWAQPVYRAAWTALLMDRNDRARALYAWTDRMVPDGYWTVKTALDCLNREAAGEYPPGIYQVYCMIKHVSDRAVVTEQIVKQFPTFAPAWKDLAVLRTSYSAREEAITRGLESRPDRETKAFLQLYRGQLLNANGQRAKARALFRELIDGSEGTAQTRVLARLLLLRGR